MKAGFTVRLFYVHEILGDGVKRGLWVWCRSVDDLLYHMDKLKITPEHVTELRILKAGESEYREHDPSILKRFFPKTI